MSELQVDETPTATADDAVTAASTQKTSRQFKGRLSQEDTIVATQFTSTEKAISGEIRQYRRQNSMGESYVLKVPPAPELQTFRELTATLRAQSREAQLLFDQGIGDDIFPSIVEIDATLEQLYRCGYGDGDALKSIILALQSQIKNQKTTKEVVAFIVESSSFLASQRTIDDSAVDVIYKIVESHGLDSFRGTLTANHTRKRYKIVEVADE